jgi:hypothetical protein
LARTSVLFEAYESFSQSGAPPHRTPTPPPIPSAPPTPPATPFRVPHSRPLTPPQARLLTRVINCEEYDAATRLSPAACPLFAAGDTRCGQRLLLDAAADAAASPAALPPSVRALVAGRLAARADALARALAEGAPGRGEGFGGGAKGGGWADGGHGGGGEAAREEGSEGCRSGCGGGQHPCSSGSRGGDSPAGNVAGDSQTGNRSDFPASLASGGDFRWSRAEDARPIVGRPRRRGEPPPLPPQHPRRGGGGRRVAARARSTATRASPLEAGAEALREEEGAMAAGAAAPAPQHPIATRKVLALGAGTPAAAAVVVEPDGGAATAVRELMHRFSILGCVAPCPCSRRFRRSGCARVEPTHQLAHSRRRAGAVAPLPLPLPAASAVPSAPGSRLGSSGPGGSAAARSCVRVPARVHRLAPCALSRRLVRTR